MTKGLIAGACMVGILGMAAEAARSQEVKTPAGFTQAWDYVGVSRSDKYDTTSGTSSIDGAWAIDAPLGPLAGTTANVACEVAFYPTTAGSVCGAGTVQFTLRVAGRKVLRRSDAFLDTFCDNAAGVSEDVDLSDFEPTDILSCTAKVKTGGAVTFIDGGSVYVRSGVGRFVTDDARSPRARLR